jgi:tyrosine-protein kinase Etk/Wzc
MLNGQGAKRVMRDQIVEQERDQQIDILRVLSSLYGYRWSIGFITVLFMLATAVYLYFLPNVYRATTSIKVGGGQSEYAKDVISIAMGNGKQMSGSQRDLLTSRRLSQKALSYVDFEERYYVIENYRPIEIYTHAPIKVEMKRGEGIVFDLEMLEGGFYRLEVNHPFSYDQIHHYDAWVSTNYFELKVSKKSHRQEKHYRFMIEPQERVLGVVGVKESYGSAGVLYISVEDTVPLRAKEYADALAEAYITLHIENKMEEASQRLHFIEKQLDEVSKSLMLSDGDLESFRKDSNIVDVEHSSQVLLSRMESYESELVELKIKEEMLNDFAQSLESSKRIETLSVEGIEDSESIIAGLMQKLQEALVERKVLQQDYTNIHPLVIKVNKRIIQLKATIKNSVENLQRNLQKRLMILQKNIAKEKQRLDNLPKRERKFGELERNFEMNEEMKRYLMKQKSEAQMVQASTLTMHQVLDKALVPVAPIKPQRAMMLLLGIVMGLVVGVMFALLRLFLHRKIHSEADISALVSYPIVGTVPHVRKKRKKGDRKRGEKR